MTTPILREALSHFFREIPSTAPDEPIIVGFSGGADSSALLHGLMSLSPSLGFRPVAAHLDHGMDLDSPLRANRAKQIAEDLGVEFWMHRQEVESLQQPGESLEAAARRVRYGFLEEARSRATARYIATAHHLDDQAETVAMRLAFGTGLRGLAAIQPMQEHVLRPILQVPNQELRKACLVSGIHPIEDPSNLDRKFTRNHFRHDVLPFLKKEIPDLAGRLAELADLSRRVRHRLDQRLAAHLQPQKMADGSLSISLSTFQELPASVRSWTLAWLHERAGLSFPASHQASAELERQLARGSKIGCDCGAGWRWERHFSRLVLRRQQAATPFFTYTFAVPGVQDIPELGLRLELRRMRESALPASNPQEDSQDWVSPFSGTQRQTLRASLTLPMGSGQKVTVRNRRPGDRVRPMGRRSTYRLKEVLIDHRIPRPERDRLPLLCVGDQIAWVPAVTIDERFRPADPSNNWLAEITRP